MINEDSTIIFSSYTGRITEWDTARGIKAYRHPNGTVSIRISSETEREDAKHKSMTITAEEAEQLGRVLLCIPEDEDFGEIMSRAMEWSE